MEHKFNIKSLNLNTTKREELLKSIRSIYTICCNNTTADLHNFVNSNLHKELESLEGQIYKNKLKVCKNWLLNLSLSEIDFKNKVENLYDELGDKYHKVKENPNIELIVFNLIKEKITQHANKIASNVVELTEECVNWGSCKPEDWSAGLYNYDKLYLDSINIALLQI